MRREELIAAISRVRQVHVDAQIYDYIARLAEVETSVYRLAVQIRRTFRRVNALEKVVIPSHRRMLAWIANVLEENDREDFTRMKMAREGLENEGGGIL